MTRDHGRALAATCSAPSRAAASRRRRHRPAPRSRRRCGSRSTGSPSPSSAASTKPSASGAFAKRGLARRDHRRPRRAGRADGRRAARSSSASRAADEVVIARDRGTDVVAVFATYQTCPQGIMAHASRGVDVARRRCFAARGTLAVEPGLPYVKFLEKRYDFAKLQGRSVRRTASRPSSPIRPFAQQVFVTAEPIAARRAGADPKVFLIAESGFDPYAAVVITHGETLRTDAARVAASSRRCARAGRATSPIPRPRTR